jgi:4-hydroxy-tetrahydrodipicolinate reductase
MKIALLGKGRTGSKVLELATNDNVTVFDLDNPISADKLTGHDVIISFLPGEVFKDYLHLLADTKIPVITGSTGFDWPENFNKQLQENKVSWIYGHNFALGMNVVKIMIEKMSLLKELFNDFETKIHEVHHVHKKDAPSGTAIHWSDWFGGTHHITSDRTGDVVGFHEITFDSATEQIKLTHEAKDRAIFAQGALWAANLVTKNTNIPAGLNQFNEVVRDYLKI